MKVIFVDVDGPLSYGTWADGKVKINEDLEIPYPWETEQCLALAEIIGSTDSKVVISSDWKKSYSIDELNQIFEYYGIPGVVIGVTGPEKAKMSSWLDQDRAYQIVKWLDEHKGEVEEWVAIDDLNVGKWLDLMKTDYPFVSKNNHVWIWGDWSENCTVKLTDCTEKIIDHLNGRINRIKHTGAKRRIRS